MVSLMFSLSRLRRKKSVEIMKHTSICCNCKIITVNKNGNVRGGKNIIQFLFTPIVTNIGMHLISTRTLSDNLSLNELIDENYSDIILKENNLSSENTKKISLRELLITGGLKDHLYLDNYTNLIYGFVKDKYSSLILSMIEIFESTKKLNLLSMIKADVVIRNKIGKEITMLRSPPKAFLITQNLLNVA